MIRKEIVGAIAAIGVFAGGAIWIGELNGRLKALERQDNVVAQPYRGPSENRPEVRLSFTTKIDKRVFRGRGTKVDRLWSEADSCSLTAISGTFGKPGQYVEVVEVDGRWVLRGSAAGHGRFQATATCIKAVLVG